MMAAGSGSPSSDGEPDPALQALDRLLEAFDAVERTFAVCRERADYIKSERSRGRPFRELVPAETPPPIVQLVSHAHHLLSTAGSAWRREEARALYDEGMSMDTIAGLFGVTRQRVSALLADRDRSGQATDSPRRDD